MLIAVNDLMLNKLCACGCISTTGWLLRLPTDSHHINCCLWWSHTSSVIWLHRGRMSWFSNKLVVISIATFGPYIFFFGNFHPLTSMKMSSPLITDRPIELNLLWNARRLLIVHVMYTVCMRLPLWSVQYTTQWKSCTHAQWGCNVAYNLPEVIHTIFVGWHPYIRLHQKFWNFAECVLGLLPHARCSQMEKWPPHWQKKTFYSISWEHDQVFRFGTQS